MFRNTKAKATVENILSSTTIPLSLRSLFTKARFQLPNMAFSTLYRIIRNFEKESKVIRVDWRERGGRYEWAKREHHHHLVCENCDSVTDLDDSTLNYDGNLVSMKTGFLVKHHSIELFGLCKPCRESVNI